MEKTKDILIQAYAQGDGNTDTKKPAKVSGIAYNGGLLNVWGDGIVVDLEGMVIPESLPLLADHDVSVASKVGEITAKVEGNKLTVSGVITAESFLAKNIISQSKNGGKWQLSIGASIKEIEYIAKETEINGIAFAAGTAVARHSELREVSVVAVGADAETELEIAAKAKLDVIEGSNKNEVREDLKMADKIEKNAEVTVDIQAALKAERERIKAIKDVCDGDVEVENQAIEAGWDANRTAAEMLKKIKASRPSVNVIVKTDAPAEKTIEAALMLRAGVDEKTVAKECGERALEAGYRDRGISIQEAAKACLQASGKSVGHSFGNAEIKAAFSTELPGILGNVTNKRLQQAFTAYSPVALKLAQTADLNNFQASDIFSISDDGNLVEVANTGDNTGKLTSSKFVEGKGTNQLKTYGKIVSITRQDIINDNLGAFLKAADILGTRCAKKIDQLFFAKVLANAALADQNALFSVAHKNLVDISTHALSVDSVKKAIAEFLKQTGLDGEPAGVMPKYLVVPPELFFLAKEICESQYMIGGNSKSAASNPVNGLLTAVQSPYLSNATYTGYSATNWYLIADPSEMPAFEIGFLKGQTTPTIEGSDAEFDTLGYSWRCYYDLGVGVADYRGALKAGTIPAETSSGE